MNESVTRVIELVSKAFGSAAGPTTFRYPESGWWYEWEGKGIAKVLLDLDPRDLEYDEILSPIDGSFVPAWTTGEGLMRLTPGIVRICFEVDPNSADALLHRLFTELYDRIRKGELTLSALQGRSLLQMHEVFYGTEDFGWNPDKHAHPLCELLRQPKPD
ncbi:MAG: hypothetical protein EOP84_03560 [Verrucomicrobiaceae bacterium]|nr:MAG: hypothetical protein EOP84_03560 [Verrucomicrobiaceae bacterium]